MSLDKTDLITIETWFTELQTYKKTQKDKYILLRDKIYTFLYHKFADLLRTKTYEWSKKFALTDEDANSIFNDVLLNCVEHYHPREVKFLTYFWLSCDNQAKNYYKKYRRKRRIPPASTINIDFNALTIDTSTQPIPNQYNPVGNAVSLAILTQIRNLYDDDTRNGGVKEVLQGCLEDLTKKLTTEETNILQSIITGSSIAALSDDLDLEQTEIEKSLKSIRKKAKHIFKKYE